MGQTHADVIVDQVNVDPVNSQQSPISGGSTGQSAGLTDRWDPRVSALQKKKKKLSARRRAENLHGLPSFLGSLGRTRPDSSSPFSFLFRG